MAAPGTLTGMPETFRLVVVPGVTVDKWARLWTERQPGVDLRILPADGDPAGALLDGRAEAGLLRLPVDQGAFHAIPLYTEATVVVVPREHHLAAADELTLEEFAGEPLLLPEDDVLAWPSGPGPAPPDRPATTAGAVELVAAEVGILLVPQSLARLHHRRDLTYRVVTDAPTSSVALVWPRAGHTDLVEEMIGIVRGRTVNSTRGSAPVAPPEKRGATRKRRAPK